jgi:hypothetical protein
MRLPALGIALAAVILASCASARADEVDFVIQAGHEGRPESCAPLHVKACNLGTGAAGERERDWTRIVADEAARKLRAAGYTVVRRPADDLAHDTARAAVFLHFDGSVVCHSGASVGFPAETSRGFIDAWERRYRALFPYRFVGENFTTNERQYYGFRKVDAPEKLLIEFGEMTCPVQYAWMAPRLHELGDVVAEFLIEQTPR